MSQTDGEEVTIIILVTKLKYVFLEIISADTNFVIFQG